MTIQQQSRPIKRLRAALIKAGFRVGGYKEFKKTFALYIGRKHGQQKIFNAAKRLGFKNVVKSGKTSIALPKRKKSCAVIRKNTKSPETCVILKKYVTHLLNGITPNVRMEIMRSTIKNSILNHEKRLSFPYKKRSR
jgi:hypothetical protein